MTDGKAQAAAERVHKTHDFSLCFMIFYCSLFFHYIHLFFITFRYFHLFFNCFSLFVFVFPSQGDMLDPGTAEGTGCRRARKSSSTREA